MIAFWGAAVALLVWGIRASRASYSATPAAALKILAHRFAAGEIDRDEFQEQRELLEDRRMATYCLHALTAASSRRTLRSAGLWR